MYDSTYLSDIRYNKKTKLYLPKGFKFIEKPYRHQVVTFIHGIHLKNIAILSTMGTGKTFCAINIARFWKQKKEAGRVLIICPSSVLYNWVDEVHMFSEYTAIPLHGAGGAISREERKQLFLQKGDFYIINYEATLHYLKQILQIGYDIVIFDESSKIANPRAQQTKACWKIASLAKIRMILNGTPIPNKPDGLWSQYYALDFGDTLGKAYHAYRKQYFASIKMRKGGKYFSVYKIRNTAALQGIAARINKSSIRYTKEECFEDMPGKTYQTRLLSLPQTTRKLYNEVLHSSKLEISKIKQQITAEILLTKFVKTIQITSGFLKTDEGNFIKLKKNPKLSELGLILDEILPEESVVIWCKYRYSIRLVKELLNSKNIEFLEITGDTTNKSKAAKKFQKSPIPAIICQIRAGGMGLNLHKACFSIFFENEWRLQDRLQAEDRIHRIGQTKPCTYIDLVAEDTIDELILAGIKQKVDVANHVLSNVI